MTRHRYEEDYGDWLYHKQRDDELDLLGVIAQPAKPTPKPLAACYAPPQWKPTKDQPDPPF
jgi:hypothetical protein